MELIARTYPDKTSGTAFHIIMNKDDKRVHMTVWEMPSGEYISVDREFMKRHMDANTDPVPELMEMTGYRRPRATTE